MPSMRSVTLGLWVTVGSRDEAGATYGCSHFLEHLLFKGTTTRTARDIAEILDSIGGDANAFTSREVTCFYARALDRDLPIAMDVLSDMVRDATNLPADVEAERDVVLEEINIHLDTPDDLVMTDISELLFGGHPLGAETLGSTESIATMERDTIHDWFLTHYRPRNLVVVAAGNVDHDHLLRLVDGCLGDLGRPGGAPLPRTAPGPLVTGQAVVRHRPTEQAHVVLGAPAWDVHAELRPALRLATTIIGGGMSSRLFQEIREVRGLAYNTFAFASAYTDAGMIGAYAGTNPAKAHDLVEVLRVELDRFPDTLTADEVEHARSALLGATVLGLEDTGSRMSRLGSLAVAGLPLRTIDESLARIEAATLEEVRAAARLYAAPRSLAVVGPFDPSVEHDRFLGYVA